MDGDTEIVGGDKAELTVTVTALEVTLVVPLSVTLSSKLQAPIADRTPVDALGLSPTLQENELPRVL